MHYLNTLSALLCLHPSPAGGDAEGVHYADQPSAARHILVTIASHPPLHHNGPVLLCTVTRDTGYSSDGYLLGLMCGNNR